MLDLLDVPDELLSLIFRSLAVVDLKSVSRTCNKFREISNSEQIWKWYCWRDYKVDEKRLWTNWTFRDLYTNVLQKYSYTFGPWQRELAHYGGLIFVQMEKEGIVGYNCLPPYDDMCEREYELTNYVQAVDRGDSSLRCLRFSPLFVIKPHSSSGTLSVYQSLPTTRNDDGGDHTVYLNAELSHRCDPWYPAVIKRREVSDESASGFILATQRPDCFSVDWNYWFQQEYGFRVRADANLEEILKRLGRDKTEKSYYLYGMHFCHKFQLLAIQRNLRLHYLKPGLYSGTYGSHGWEIINFSYNDNEKTLEGRKVTGDRNVPADKISITVSLQTPIRHRAGEMGDFTTVGALNIVMEHPSAFDYEPFKIREGVHCDRPLDEIPKGYRASYAASGQVAGDEFSDPETVTCSFYVFSEDSCAVYWTPLGSLSLYYRANNVDDLFQ